MNEGRVGSRGGAESTNKPNEFELRVDEINKANQMNGAGLLLKERGVMAGGPLAQLDFSSINFVDFRSTIFAPFPFFAPAKRGQPLFYFIHSQTKGKKEIS